MAKKSPARSGARRKSTSRKKSGNRKKQGSAGVAAWTPTTAVRTLAGQVIWEPHKHKAFRKRAAVAGSFRKELQMAPQYQQLTDDAEYAFCEGWLELARLESGGDPEVLDFYIVNRLKATMYNDGLGPYSG